MLRSASRLSYFLSRASIISLSLQKIRWFFNWLGVLRGCSGNWMLCVMFCMYLLVCAGSTYLSPRRILSLGISLVLHIGSLTCSAIDLITFHWLDYMYRRPLCLGGETMQSGNLHELMAFLCAAGLALVFPDPILSEEITAKWTPYVVQRAQLD